MKVLCILMAATLCAAAAPADPGKAAVDFLEKVRLRKLNLEPGGDTALSAQTEAEKKRQIAKQLERMAGDLGSDPLEIGPIKTDEDFAAVIVRKVGGFDPGRLQVFAVAMVKRGADWIAAPVPASFENSGAGYGATLRARLESLETWMLREQVNDLENLREQSKERMRRKIEGSLTAAELRKLGPKEIGERFLTACEKRDLASALGLLGGLASKLPDDWPARLTAADRALGLQNGKIGAWRLLTAPDVARVVARTKSGSEDDYSHASIAIGCLDPSGGNKHSPQIRMVDIDLLKSAEGLWRVDLPAEFFNDSGTEEDVEDEGEPDVDRTDSFSIQWSAQHPATPFADSDQVRTAWLAALRESTPRELLAMSKLKGPSGYATKAALEVARMWWTIHDPAVPRLAIPLSFQEIESSAVALIQIFSPRDPDRLDARAVYFEKTPEGWIWTPEPSVESRARLGAWVDSETRLWPGKWQQQALADCPKVQPDALTAPDADTARKCVQDWMDAITKGDFTEVLRHVACIGDGSDGATALQNVSYEISGARRWKETPEINGVYVGKFFAGVGLKAPAEGRLGSPFFPVVLTDKGPRVLAGIDLVAAGTRGREFLNKNAFGILEKAASPTTADDVRALFATHAIKAAIDAPKPAPK